MIDVRSITAQAKLRALRDRIYESETAHDLAQGTWRPADDFLLPPPNNNVRKKAWYRALRQMQTLGPRVMRTKIDAAIGSVTWGGDDAEVDEQLAMLDVHALARSMTQQYLVDGITAGLAHEVADGEGNGMGEFRITRLGGYLQPYTDPNDIDRVVGLFQAWSTAHGGRTMPEVRANDFDDRPNRAGLRLTWTVRIYDWMDGEDRATIREWRSLEDPTFVGGNPDMVAENAPVPRFAISSQTDDGLPMGDILVAAPQLMALWATEARLTLSEELASFPMAVVKGNSEFEEIGAGEAIALSGDGNSDFFWSEPGNLEELRKQRLLRMERIREDLALPGGFLGNDSPSGEAFKEANIRFRQASEGIATAIESVLTRLVADYAELIGTEGVAVSVSPSKEYDFDQRAQWVLQLYQAGIIPLDVAAKEMQPYFGTWDDDSLNEWIERQMATVSVDDLRGEFA